MNDDDFNEAELNSLLDEEQSFNIEKREDSLTQISPA